MNTALYKITNTINTKVYIGIASCPDKRWTTHLRCARNGKQNKLYNAMRKYGVSAFSMHVLHWCDTRDDAYELEQFVVEIAGSREDGYNTTPGGRGLGAGKQHPHYGKPRSPETVEKLRVANTGTKRPQCEKDKISITMRHILAVNPRPLPSEETRKKMSAAALGREVAQETRQKISLGLTGLKRSPRTKEHSAKLAAVNVGRKHTPEAIEKIRQSSAGRKYPDRKPHTKEVYEKIGESIRRTRLLNGRRVELIATGEVFPNAREAAKACGVSEATVSNHCNGKVKSLLRFRYQVK